MLLKDINDILQKGEGTTVEFKEAQRGVPKDLWESAVSFSNTDGGTIMLGVDDDGNVLGIDPSLILKFKKEIVTNLKNKDNINPPLFLNPTEIVHPDGTIIHMQVPASSQVHDHAGRIYVRSADADLDITGDQNKTAGLFLRKQSIFTESKIHPYLTMEDLDESLFEKARSVIRGYQQTHPWVMADGRQILNESSLYRVDHRTGERGLTLAAALIFGKDITIHNILPAYKVKAIVRIANTDRYDDRMTLRTNLIDTYFRLMEFVKRHLDEKFYQENSQRKDLRELIFREIIGNLIVHREYTSAYSSDFVIYKDKVSVTNPNKALFHGPINIDSFNPHPKNPNIRKFFTAFGWADEIGSGIRNTTKYLDCYVPGALPLFYEDDLFKTEIPLINITLADYARELVSWFDLPVDSLEHIRKGLSKINIPAEFSNSEFKEFILHSVPWWNDKGTKLKSLGWPENLPDFAETIEKVPCWDEKGTKLMHKKIRFLLSILLMTSNPASFDEMMECLNYRNRKSFRELYLIPLQQEDLIAMLYPDRPRTPNQKYAITEKGRLFLSGKDT